ncbi:MAG: PAS domain-containing protein [Spirochaetales bacterium]|nr:PAS domain-containing protein [Spirochaetales bacterium]
MDHKFRIGQYIFLAVIFVTMGPLLFSSHWHLTTTGELYISLELTGALLAMIVGLSSFLFFYSNRQYFYLLIGFGFLLSGTEDLIHGLIGINNILSGLTSHMDQHQAGTILGDDFFLAIVLIVAMIAKDKTCEGDRIRKLLAASISSALMLGSLLTLLARYSNLADIRLPVFFHSDPVQILTSLLFFTAFSLGLIKRRGDGKLFSHFLLLSVIMNAGAYFYMSFSSKAHDVFFDFGLLANTVSYIIPIIGFLVTILEQHKDLVRKEQELRKSQSRLSMIFKASPDTILVIKPDYTLDRSFLLGEKNQLPATGEQSVLDLIPAQYKEDYTKIFQKALISGRTERFEITEGKGEDKKNTLIRLISEKSENSSRSILHIATDVTELNRQKQALLNSEQRYDFAMSVANDGVWDWDLINNIQHFDNRYYVMAGYSPEAFPPALGEWEIRVHPDDLDRVKRAIDNYLNDLVSLYDEEYRFLTATGGYMWIRSRAKIVSRDENNSPTRIIGTHTDITNQKKAEEELRSTIEETRQMNDLMTGREHRIMEIKEEVNRLLEELGRERKYRVTES